MAQTPEQRIWPLLVGALLGGIGLVAVGFTAFGGISDRGHLHNQVSELEAQHQTDADRISQLEADERAHGLTPPVAPTTTTTPRSNGTTRTTQRPPTTTTPAPQAPTAPAPSSTTTTARPPSTTTTTRPCPTPVTAPVLGCPVQERN